MTQTKGHTRVNLHLDPRVHERLKEWCIKNGKTLQDGLALIVDYSTRGDGLRLVRAEAPPINTSGLFGRPASAPAPSGTAGTAPPQPAKQSARSEERRVGKE